MLRKGSYRSRMPNLYNRPWQKNIVITQRIITDGERISWKNNNSIRKKVKRKSLWLQRAKKFMSISAGRTHSKFNSTSEIINNSSHTSKDFKFYSCSISMEFLSSIRKLKNGNILLSIRIKEIEKSSLEYSPNIYSSWLLLSRGIESVKFLLCLLFKNQDMVNNCLISFMGRD